MKWRRQEAGLHFSFAALRIEEEEAIEELDFAGGANASVEIFEVGAAAKGYVLAIVYVLAIRQSIGSCAAAEVRTLFEEAYAAAGVSQRDAGRQPRQPAANHDHVFRGHYVEYAARILPGR